jgi:hypothetical protein
LQEDTPPPIPYNELTDFLDTTPDRLKAAITNLLLIPSSERTFDNFFRPWLKIKSEIYTYAYFYSYSYYVVGGYDVGLGIDSPDQLAPVLASIIDPDNLFSYAIRAFSANLLANESLDPYQRFLLENELERPSPENILFFATSNDAKNSSPANTTPTPVEFFSVLNCTMPLLQSSQENFDSVVKNILSSNADIVCVQEVSQDETCYDLYNKLKDRYSNFFVEINPVYGPWLSGTLIASNYDLENSRYTSIINQEEKPQNGSLDFVVKDNGVSIGHIYVLHVNSKQYAEESARDLVRVTNNMYLDFDDEPLAPLLLGNYIDGRKWNRRLNLIFDFYFHTTSQTGSAFNLIIKSNPSFSQQTEEVVIGKDCFATLSKVPVHGIDLDESPRT